MELIEVVKVALRLRTAAFDNAELAPIIEACKLDLKIAGVEKIDAGDALIARAVVLYAKANFGYGNDSEKFGRAYEALKASMALSGDYGRSVKNGV